MDGTMQAITLSDPEIEKIFENANPLTIPEEYIEYVRVGTISGGKIYLSGSDFKHLTSGNLRQMIDSVELSLNMEKFRRSISKQVSDMLYGHIIE